MKYSDLLKENKKLSKILTGKKFQIFVLSNIITFHLNEILEYTLRLQGINAHLRSGNYDNIVQDSKTYAKADLLIMFWDLANLIDGLHYKVNLMNNNEIETLLLKVKAEIDFVLKNLKEAPLVLFNKFSSLIFNCENIKKNNFDKICQNLNEYLEQKAPTNTILIDIDKIIAKVSVQKSVDFRFYYSSKALYAIEFYKNYAEYIKPLILAANGKTKKALIFDCDNTLWKGIVGEDGINGIEMSSKTEVGVIFEEVQYLALELNKRGILLGLCSKNNPQDINEVIVNHPDMKIRDEQITVKRVNWDDKVSNLKAIAKELNVGLDSLVFVEDSSFEVNLIKAFLPEVTVLQVPAKLHEYPKMLREHMGLFYSISETKEDFKRGELYRQQVKREESKARFSNLEDYLKSLKIEITIYIDSNSIIPRMSQMTQKTNQFNLTTKRYTEADLKRFVASDQYKVFAFNARDKFGDYGITGLAIVQFDNKNKSANIDTFLMSCRVIGRNIELSFAGFIIEYLKELDIKSIETKYIKTIKNEQVVNFYERIGFELARNAEGEKSYRLGLSGYRVRNSNTLSDSSICTA